MSVHIQKEGEGEGNEEMEGLLEKEGFVESGEEEEGEFRRFEVRLNELEKSRMNEKYEDMFRATIWKLLRGYLESVQSGVDIRELSPANFDEKNVKMFMKYLKDEHSNLCDKYHLKEVLGSEHLESLVVFQKARYLD